MPDPDPDPDTRTPKCRQGPDLLPQLKREIRTCRLWRRTVASRLVIRQPTGANLYAPSLNEAFEDDSHSRENCKCFYFFSIFICLRGTVLHATQKQRPSPPEVHCAQLGFSSRCSLC